MQRASAPIKPMKKPDESISPNLPPFTLVRTDLFSILSHVVNAAQLFFPCKMMYSICIIHSGLLFCEIFYVKTATNISSAAVLLYSSSRHSSCISLTSKNKAGWDSGCGFSHLLYYTFISYFCEYGIRLISYGSSSMTIITGFS